jgi:hypothetical protein
LTKFSDIFITDWCFLFIAVLTSQAHAQVKCRTFNLLCHRTKKRMQSAEIRTHQPRSREESCLERQLQF